MRTKRKMFGAIPKLTCKLATAFAAAALLFSTASCSSDSSGGDTILPVNPVPTEQTKTQETQAQKEAAGSYTIAGTTQ